MAFFRRLKVQAEFFEPQALGIALYVRDRLGLDLGPAGFPASRLLPAITSDPGLLDVDREKVSSQWISWSTGLETTMDRTVTFGPTTWERLGSR